MVQPPTNSSFWDRNSDWIVPGAILVLGILSLLHLL